MFVLVPNLVRYCVSHEAAANVWRSGVLMQASGIGNTKVELHTPYSTGV